MKMLSVLAMSVAVFASSSAFSNAFSQEKTRAEVRQELIQAENDGSQYITDSSYPEISQIHAKQVAQLKEMNGNAEMGTDSSGTSMSGKGQVKTPDPAAATCVGPVSFCDPFFGS